MKCSRRECDAEAVWYPVMLLYADRRRWPDAEPARAICAVPICDAHRGEITLEYLLPDESFRTIARSFHSIGKAAPRRADVRLEFGQINSDEWRNWQRSKH